MENLMKKQYNHFEYIVDEIGEQYNVIHVTAEESLRLFGREHIQKSRCEFQYMLPGDLVWIWDYFASCIIQVPIMQVSLVVSNKTAENYDKGITLFIPIHKDDLNEGMYFVAIPKPYTYEMLLGMGVKAANVFADTYTIGHSEQDYGHHIFKEMDDVVKFLGNCKTPKKRIANKMRNKALSYGPKICNYWIQTFGGKKKNVPIYPKMRA
jgi:hypothetical protein